MPLKYSDIADIIKAIDASALDHVSIELDDLKLEVTRRGAATPAPRAEPTHQVTAPPPQPAPALTPAPPNSAELATTRVEPVDGLIEIRSPMVGTFYRRPAPDADAFVEVDAQVKTGDALCLVEVMKLFTTIHAEVQGRVVEVCAEDGDLVEHDQVLFRLESD